MAPSIRTVLLGADRSAFDRTLTFVFVATLAVTTFLAYAVGVFQVEGGVVFLPGDAAVVGLLGAAIFAYQRRGLLFAWLVVFGALLAFNADHYLLGLSGRSISERVIAFLQPDGLVFLGVAALVLGTLGWAAGVVASLAVDAVSGDSTVGQQ